MGDGGGGGATDGSGGGGRSERTTSTAQKLFRFLLNACESLRLRRRVSWGCEEGRDAATADATTAADAGRPRTLRRLLTSWVGTLETYLEDKFSERDEERQFQESRRDEIFRQTLVNLGFFTTGYAFVGTATIVIVLFSPVAVSDASSETKTSTWALVSLFLASILTLPMALVTIAVSPKMHPQSLETVKSITIAVLIGFIVVADTAFDVSYSGHAAVEALFVVVVVGPPVPSNLLRKIATKTEAWTGALDPAQRHPLNLHNVRGVMGRDDPQIRRIQLHYWSDSTTV